MQAILAEGTVGIQGPFRRPIARHGPVRRPLPVRYQASIGVFDFNTANKAAADTMQMWIDKRLLDPHNLEQMNAAWNYQAKYLRDVADAAKVAGSSLPQLQQALNDASNVNKQLDQFATTSMTPVTAGMAEINL